MLPLPDYTRRKPLAGGRWGYYFTPPSWGHSSRGRAMTVAHARSTARHWAPIMVLP